MTGERERISWTNQAFVAVTLLGIYLLFPVGTEACSCETLHPQTTFCQADFVIKAKVKDEGEMLYNQKKVERNGKMETQMYPTYLRYTIKISKIFKESPAYKNVTHLHVYTSPFDSTCGIRLNNDTKYLLEGVIHNGKPYVQLCSNIQPWNDIEVRQRKGYNILYEPNCDCNIETCLSKDCEKHKKFMPLFADTCSFNPRYTKDCFTKYSMCIKRADGQCHWSRTTLLKMCLEKYSQKKWG